MATNVNHGLLVGDYHLLLVVHAFVVVILVILAIAVVIVDKATSPSETCCSVAIPRHSRF